MKHWLFRAYVYTSEWQRDEDQAYSTRWIVATAPTRSAAVPKAMRKVYAIYNRSDVFEVALRNHGTVQVAS